MRLVVTEKPSVARDLARVLGARQRREGLLFGEGLQITWCYGHMAELQPPEHYDPRWRKWSFDTLPMVPDKFALRVREDVGDHWKILESLLRDGSIDSVVNACDAGREGELIFRYVYELAGCRLPVMRLWVSSLTDTAIRGAWQRLQQGEQYDRLAAAARCRSEADWLVGLNGTRAMTCLARSVGGDQLLSVGRVQTPTLAMIVKRDRRIETFVPETFWQVKARFSSPIEGGTGRWQGTWFRRKPGSSAPAKPRGKNEPAHNERISDEATARAIAAAAEHAQGRLSTADKRQTTEQPPLLYDLTSLQRRANQRYGLSAPQTLAVAQQLYEKHKLITYPRTDARYLTPDQVPGLPDVVRGVGRLGVYRPFAETILEQPIRPGRRVVDASEVGDHHAILPTGRTPAPERMSPDEKRIYDLVARRFLAALSSPARFDVTVLIVDVDPNPQVALPQTVQTPLRFRARGRICTHEGWRRVDPPPRKAQIDLPPVRPGEQAEVEQARVSEGQTRPPPPHSDASLLRAMETAGRALEDAELKRAMRNGGLGTPATRAAIIETLLRRKYITREKRKLSATARGRALIDAVPVDLLKSAELTGRWEARLAAISEGRAEAEGFMERVRTQLADMMTAIQTAQAPPPERAPTPDSPVLGSCPVCGEPVRENRAVYTCARGRACSFVIFRKIARRNVSRRMVKQLLSGQPTPRLKGFKNRQNKPFEAALKLDPEGKVVFDFSQPRPQRKRQAGAQADRSPAGSPKTPAKQPRGRRPAQRQRRSTPQTRGRSKPSGPSPAALPEGLDPGDGSR